MTTHPGAVSPSPQDVKTILGQKGPRPTLETLNSTASIKRAGPLSPTLSDSEDEYANSHSPSSPNRQLAAISENEDAGDDDSDVEVEHARAEGVQGMKKEVNIKAGYLYKKGEKRKTWKKRYFVLRPKRICYYKDEKEYKMLRDISLEDVSTVAEVQVKRHEHVFGIVTPARTYYVEARTRPDMQKWVAEIEQARDDFKRNKSEETTTNTENAPDTPVVRPVQAPVVAPNLSQRSQPISIVAPSSPGPHTSTSTPFSSSVATTSTSPFSPDATSSSYTSQASTLSSIPPGVPPNSLIQGGAGLLGNPVELNSVDARLESRQRQNSNASSGGDVAGPITGYFRPPRPASPGVASSSEDEDDDYVGEATTPGPSTTGGLTMASGLQFGSLDPNKVIMSGYLTKQGKRKNWRKRYFILVSSRLMYSRSHMDQKIHRQIPLARILDVVDVDPRAPTPARNKSSHSAVDIASPDPNDKRYENSFRIITAKRTFTVCAPDEESEIKWISAIKVLLNAQRQSQQGQSSTPVARAVSSAPSTQAAAPDTNSLPPPVAGAASSPLPSPHMGMTAQPASSAATRAPSANALPSIEAKLEQASLGKDGLPRPQQPSLAQTRHRSATDAAKLAVREAGERYSART